MSKQNRNEKSHWQVFKAYLKNSKVSSEVVTAKLTWSPLQNLYCDFP